MKINMMNIKLTAFVLAIVYLFPANLTLAAQGEGKGRYMQHQYSYKEKNGRVAASFQPFLPRNDAIVIGAMLELINKVYGKHQVEDLKPGVVSRNGKNLLRFNGIGYDYFFLLIKQDTGEVHGMSMWREKKV